MTDTDRKDREREADEVGCYGLVGGWAKNLYTHEAFEAAVSTKDNGPFYCDVCKSDAVIRKCTEKRDHYAHSSRLTPVIGPEESALHLSCKTEICALLAERFPDGKWAVERPIRANLAHKIPELVPDISGRIGESRVAIEVQASALSVTKIVKRATHYTQRNIALLWVVPLTESLGKVPFRPRLYERYLHSIYFGRTYYWWHGLGLGLRPVHYAAASRWVEEREWYEDGELMTGGGYNADYKIIKKPDYGRDLNLADDFKLELRPTFTPENERKEVPQCLVWRDSLSPWWETPP